jgi:hypothetical protein
MSSVILGTDMDTGEAVRIGDVERRSGLYLLGRMGMGKSALAVNVALQDIDLMFKGVGRRSDNFSQPP